MTMTPELIAKAAEKHSESVQEFMAAHMSETDMACNAGLALAFISSGAAIHRAIKMSPAQSAAVALTCVSEVYTV